MKYLLRLFSKNPEGYDDYVLAEFDRLSKYLIFMLLLLPLSAVADSSHHHSAETRVVDKSSGTASAIAMSQLSFDWSTQALQVSGGVGSHNGENALSIGIGKRFGQVLLNGSVSKDSMGAGFTLRLK